jgi:hypothetical protein
MIRQYVRVGRALVAAVVVGVVLLFCAGVLVWKQTRTGEDLSYTAAPSPELFADEIPSEWSCQPQEVHPRKGVGQQVNDICTTPAGVRFFLIYWASDSEASSTALDPGNTTCVFYSHRAVAIPGYMPGPYPGEMLGVPEATAYFTKAGWTPGAHCA